MAKKEYPIAKITRPTVRGIYERERLFRIFDDCRERPITWTTGPPGAGKTTLVSSYLESRKLPCLWYQADQGDADIATFFYYLGLAAKKAVPKIRKPLPLFTSEYLQGITAFTHRYFESLYQKVKPPFVLVFDNYQDIPLDSDFHDALREGLSVLPEDINVIVISRSNPPPAFARLRASEKISLVGWDAVKFDHAEIEGLVATKEPIKLPADVMEQLCAATDGWAAGLILFLQTVKNEDIDLRSLNNLRSEEFFDYFANEIFAKADRLQQEFLLKTSFLPKLTPAVAERLTHMRNADQILSELNRRHYFTDRMSLHERDRVYQYHPLFREFLMSRAKAEYSAEETAQIQRRAATLLTESGQGEDAIGLLRDARDWQGCQELILAKASSLIEQGRSRTLETWIQCMPEELIEKTPWLLYWLAVCRHPLDPTESHLLYDRAFQAFQADKEAAGTLLAWSGAVHTLIIEGSDLTRLDRLIEWLDDRVRRRLSYPSTDVEAHVASSMAAALIHRRPKHPQFQRWLKQSLALAHRCSNVNIGLQTYFHVAYYYSCMGDMVKLRLMADVAERITSFSAASPFFVIGGKMMATFKHSWFMASYARALESVTEGIELSKESGVHGLDYGLLALGAISALGNGDSDLARSFLQQIESVLVSTNNIAVISYNDTAALYHMSTGNLSHAVVHAETAVNLAETTGEYFYFILAGLVMARVSVASGEYDRAESQLASVRKRIRESESSICMFVLLMIEAELAIETGNEVRASELLAKALPIGKPHKHMNVLWWWWQPSTIARLFGKALDAGIETKYVQELIRSRKLTPDETYAGIEAWPWDLIIYTLGTFEIEREGKALRFSGKIQQKPLSLLKALIAFGGKNVAEDQLSYSLWPDADGDQAHKSLEVTLLRLRRLLNTDQGIQLREGKLTLDRRYCWVDAWAFESMIEEAEHDALQSADLGRSKETQKRQRSRSAFGTPQSERMYPLLERILRMYRGNFLPGDASQSWSISYRERLRSKFIRTILKLGEQLEHKGQFEKAVECYQKGLEVDSLAEAFYQRLMICCRQLGQQAEGIAVYRRCHSVLSSRLGLTPSSRTESIYKTLTEHADVPPLGGA